MLYTRRDLLCLCPSPSPIEHNRLPPSIQLVLLPPPLCAPLRNLPKLPQIIIRCDILLRIIPTELYFPPILTCIIQVLCPTCSVYLYQGIIDSPFIGGFEILWTQDNLAIHFVADCENHAQDFFRFFFGFERYVRA